MIQSPVVLVMPRPKENGEAVPKTYEPFIYGDMHYITNSLNFRVVWPCIVIDSLRIKPTDALSSNFIIGNNNSTCSGQSFCSSSGASQPYKGVGTIYAAR